MSATLVKITVVLTKGELSKFAPDASHPVSPYRETSVVVTDSGGVAQKAVCLNGKESPPWTFEAHVPPAVVPVNLVHSVRAVPGVLATVVATDLDIAGNAIGEPVKYIFKDGEGALPAFLPTIGIKVTAAPVVVPHASPAPTPPPGAKPATIVPPPGTGSTVPDYTLKVTPTGAPGQPGSPFSAAAEPAHK